MKLFPETQDIKKYLRFTEIIDFNNINIIGLALFLSGACKDEIEKTKSKSEI